MASAVTSRDDGLCVGRRQGLGRAENSPAEKRRAALVVLEFEPICLVVTDKGRMELGQRRTNNDKTTRSST